MPPPAPEWTSRRRSGRDARANRSAARTRPAREAVGTARRSRSGRDRRAARHRSIERPSRVRRAECPCAGSFDTVWVTSTTTRSRRTSSCAVVAEPRSSASSKRETSSDRTALGPSILRRRATRSTLCSSGNEPSTATREIHAFARSGAFATGSADSRASSASSSCGFWRYSKLWAQGVHGLGKPSRESAFEVADCRSRGVRTKPARDPSRAASLPVCADPPQLNASDRAQRPSDPPRDGLLHRSELSNCIDVVGGERRVLALRSSRARVPASRSRCQRRVRLLADSSFESLLSHESAGRRRRHDS